MTAKSSTHRSDTGTKTAELQPLARRFEIWRATRPRGQRIPEELWRAAAQCARRHGLNPTVAALKLNYYDLQRRLQAGPGGDRKHHRAPRFVEVPAPPYPPGGDERGTVEVRHADGARLILRLSDPGSAELLSLVEAFLRHSR